MDSEVIDRIRREVASDIRVNPFDGKVRIGTPLLFDDGDHCSFFLVEDGERLVLSDRGDVFMRASYEDADLRARGHRPRFERLMTFYGMEEVSGEIVMPVRDDKLGSAIFNFAQGVLELVRLAATPAEKKRRAERKFKMKVGNIIKARVPEHRLAEGWHDPQHDPQGYYAVDFRIAAPTDWYLFVVGTGNRCLHATVSCQHYKLGHTKFKSAAFYRDRSMLPKSAVAPLSDVVDLSIDRATDKMVAEFIERHILGAA